MTNARVICILGLIGSGKDEVANYLERKYGYKKIVMGDIVRSFVRKDGLEITRENQQIVQKKYRDKFGQLFFSDQVVKSIEKNGWDRVVIVGSRRPEETKFFKEHFRKNIGIVVVGADPETRFQRLTKRKRGDEPKTFEEFLEQEKNEFRLFEFEKSFKYADYKIENNGDLVDLHKNIDSFLAEAGWKS
jgi:dephospho-CoA kinase